MITQAQLTEMVAGAARVHRLRGEYLKTYGTLGRQRVMRQIVELEHSLSVKFGLVLDRWDLEEAPPSVA